MKTEAGKQRIVPIHPRILKFVERNYKFAISINSEYLLMIKDRHIPVPGL